MPPRTSFPPRAANGSISQSIDDALSERLNTIKEQAELARMLGDVQRCRDDFEYYYRRVFVEQDPIQFPWGKHHHAVIRFITWPGHQGVAPNRKLVVMPPGTGKSNIVSKALPSWLAGKYPDRPTCLATSTSTLATDRSLYLRELVDKDKAWKLIWKDVVPYNVQWRTDQWTMVRRGEDRPKSSEPTFRCTGADASIGGIRVTYGIVDDLHNHNNSRTPTERQRVKDWYYTQFESRLTGMNGWLVMLANIWHGNDLTVELWNGGQFAVLHMMALYPEREVWADVYMPVELGNAGPAFADYCEVARENWTWNEKERKLRLRIHGHGPALWPEHIPLAELKAKRKNGSQRFERVWNGSRTTTGGGTYKREWFKYWSEANRPRFKWAQMSWDTASEQKESADYTAGVLQWIGEDGALYKGGLFREQIESGVGVPLAIVCWYLDARQSGINVRKVLIEKSTVAMSSIKQAARGWERREFIEACQRYLRHADPNPTLVALIRRVLANQDSLPDMIKVPIKPIPVRAGGKEAMHEDAAAHYEAGNVYHLAEMDGLQVFEDELESVPGGANDDMADANAQGIVEHFGVMIVNRLQQESGGHMLVQMGPAGRAVGAFHTRRSNGL